MSDPSGLTSRELKGERIKLVTGRELMAVAVLTLAIVTCANVAARWAVDKLSPNLGFVVYQTKWTQLLSRSEPADWVVLGDSSANQGVDPRVLERDLGGTAVNLATLADATAVMDAWMLQRYIDRFGPPRAAVLVHVYDMWSRGFEYQLMAETPLPWGFWTGMEPRVDMGLRHTLQVAEFRYLPLYTRKESLLLLLHGETYAERPAITDSGFMSVTHASAHGVAADAREHLEFTRTHTFRISPENRRALDTIATLANRYNFDVFLANSPLYSGVYEDPAFRRYYEDVVGTLDTWVAANRHIHYLFEQPLRFSSDVMTNVDHVTAAAASRYSDELARRLSSLVPPFPDEDGCVTPSSEYVPTMRTSRTDTRPPQSSICDQAQSRAGSSEP
jgi:hypothetical protein